MKIDDLHNLDQDKVLLVDIREPQELAVEPSIPGAINIPMSTILQEVERGNLPMDKTIVTICRSGARCHVVNAELRARGFITDMLEGGMNAYH